MGPHPALINIVHPFRTSKYGTYAKFVGSLAQQMVIVYSFFAVITGTPVMDTWPIPDIQKLFGTYSPEDALPDTHVDLANKLVLVRYQTNDPSRGLLVLLREKKKDTQGDTTTPAPSIPLAPTTPKTPEACMVRFQGFVKDKCLDPLGDYNEYVGFQS